MPLAGRAGGKPDEVEAQFVAGDSFGSFMKILAELTRARQVSLLRARHDRQENQILLEGAQAGQESGNGGIDD